MNTLSDKDLSTEEIDIKELADVLWRNKILILLFSTLTLVLATAYIWSQPDEYLAEATLYPQKSEASSAIPSSLGFVASLSGGSLDKEITSKDLAIEVLKSRDFFELLYFEENFLKNLFAIQSYDPIKEISLIDSSIYDEETGSWQKEFLENSDTGTPSFSKSYKEFHNLLNFNENIETGFVSISLRHPSPEIAIAWLNNIVPKLNAYVRDIKLTKANLALEFLGTELKNTKSNELQKVIVNLMENNLQVITLANISDDFVFSFVDTPRVDYQKVQPNRLFFSMAGFFLGTFLAGLLTLILRYVYNREMILSFKKPIFELRSYRFKDQIENK